MAMAFRRRWIVLIGLSLAVVLLAAIAHRKTTPVVTDVTVSVKDGPATPIALPYSGPAPTDRPLEFAFHVRATALTQRWFVIVPDDHLVSISVNGVDESLAGVDPKKLDDYHDGFRFPLGRNFTAGENRIVVRVANKGGPGGLDVHSDPRDWRNALELGLAACASLVLFGAVLRRAGCRWVTIALAIVGVCVRFGYLWVTPYSLRTHDVEGHVEYIQYLLDHHSLPRAQDGYSFYHPPLYYSVSAVVWKVLGALGFARDEILAALQLQSMAFDLGFAAFAIGTARLWLDRIPETALGRGWWSRSGLSTFFAALIFVWPSNVIHCGLVGNDALTYLFLSGGFFFASRWWLRGGDRNVNLAAVLGALGIVTKTSCLLVFVVLAALFMARLVVRYRERRPLRAWNLLKRSAPALALLAASTGLALGRSILETLTGRQTGNVFVTNAGRNTPTLAVGNRAENYLWFDLHGFVTQAFTSPWDDAKGRQFFWNYFLKTALFGEYDFPHPLAWNLAVVLSVLLLSLCVHTAIGTLARRPSEWLDELPMFLVAGGLVASLAALRIMIPSACSGDFRYVIPVLTPFAWWYVRGIAAYRERGWVKGAVTGSVIGCLFAGLSVAFIAVVVVTSP